MSTLQPSLTKYIRKISTKNVRTFAAAAAQAKPSSGEKENTKFLPREELSTTTSDGLSVSTVETNKPISRVAIYFKAGARHQDESSPGTVHALRIAAGLGSSRTSQFAITRNIQALGGNFYCTVGREHIGYTLEAPRDHIEKLGDLFKDAVARQVFRPWELTDSVPRLRDEVLTLSPEVRALEMIHWASYRRGLGNSLYSPKYMIGKHTHDVLADFVKKNFVHASIVGVGVSQEVATRFTQNLGLEKGDNTALPCKFSSGEIRKEIGGDLAYVCIALEGAGLNDRKSALVGAVVQRALGSGPRTKRGNNSGGKLSGANSVQSSASGFSASYSDSGILGAYIIGTPNAIQQATKKSVEVLRNASFTDEEVTRAKNILKFDIASALDSESELLEDIALQSLSHGSVSSFNDTAKLIDSISSADVNNLIKKGKSKFSMAAIGRIGKVPYLDEL